QRPGSKPAGHGRRGILLMAVERYRSGADVGGGSGGEPAEDVADVFGCTGDATTAMFKYAKRPFDSEDQALRLAHTFGVPVAQLHGSAVLGGWLGMLMEDLDPAVRDAD